MKNRTKLPAIFLALVTAALYLPLVMVVLYSFNEGRSSAMWSGFSLDWYARLFRDPAMFEALGNSLILALASSVCAAVIGTLGAYGFTKVKARTKGAMEYLSMLPILIPEIVLGMVFLAFFSLLGMPFGMTTLIVAHTAFCVPYVYMLVKARLVGIDPSLAEAARDLGAGEVRVFFDITLPLLAPSILSGMLLSFAMSFDDVIISLFVTGVNVNTLPIKIYTQIKAGVTPEINALCTLILIAVILLVFLSRLLGRIGRPGRGTEHKPMAEEGSAEIF